MILIRLLGLLDFIAAAALFIMKYHILASFGVILGLYLIIKGVIFFSTVSIVDILAGVMLILAALGTYMPFNWIFVLWLAQKSIFSFLLP